MASKLAWQSLSADDNRLPEELRAAIAALQDAKDAVEEIVKTVRPAPKGRKWVFTYKYGVAIAHADAGGNTTDYFSR
jgi:hypothetical protein